jgi:DNA invertase Pin-like site-specific DNA recombinase
MFATFAQEERRKISERIKMALDRKRAEYEARGERFPIGRPKGRYTIRPKHIRILKEAGYELKEIASDHLLCHVNHVSRIWNKLQKGQLEYE